MQQPTLSILNWSTEMPENYDEMMNKTLEAYGQSTGSIPDPQTFTVVEQLVYEYVREEENGS